MLKKFISLNQKICARIASYLPQTRADLFPAYEKAIACYMNAAPGLMVADVGGGRSCPFAVYRDTALGTKIISIDIAPDELNFNNDVDEKRVADITRDLPLAPEEADLIVSRSVLEHLKDLPVFFDRAKTSLKEGGYFIHLFPARFAPFALLNRILPHKIARRILFFFFPDKKGVSGFPAYYRGCYYTSIRKLLDKYGFEPIEIKVSYYQSSYFGFFIPLFLIIAFYELLIYFLKIKNLAAYILIIAKKK